MYPARPSQNSTGSRRRRTATTLAYPRGMRIARYIHDGEVAFGVVEGPAAEDGEVAEVLSHPFGPITFSGRRRSLSDVKLLAPVLPSKVVAIGKNYAAHASEMGGDVPEQPLLFLKPSTAVIGPGETIGYPQSSQQVDYEGELAVVIGRLCRDVPAELAMEVVLGYTCGNDITARDQQRSDGQWSRAKGYDSFCPLGPWLETDLEIDDLRITTTLNGEVKQDARTAQIVHKVPSLIAHISACMTLLPGDVIMTGTPEGVGPMAIGDEVSVEIEGIGKLTNMVTARG
jgi:2-keto-4-pentenoate hydratase/2-oxohepta-3-ene-1,7-dioic acid hydratase in catechol pathway